MSFKNYLPETFIERPDYIKKAEPFIGKDIVKVFTGQRRVGKTYLLFQMMDFIHKKNKKANIVFVGKELPEFSQIINDSDLLEYVKPLLKSKDNFLFIDEVQEILSF